MHESSADNGWDMRLIDHIPVHVIVGDKLRPSKWEMDILTPHILRVETKNVSVPYDNQSTVSTETC